MIDFLLVDNELDHWSDLAIIFMGKELSDNFTFSGCDLSDYSIIHALDTSTVNSTLENCDPTTDGDLKTKFSDKLTTIDETEGKFAFQRPERILADDDDDDVNQDVDLSTKSSYFFVYCKHCSSMQHGKLRVVCETCDQSSIFCLDEPQNWSDVLSIRKIRTKCFNDGCDGCWARFFFKCFNECQHDKSDRRFDGVQSVVPLNRIRHNNISVSCLACLDSTFKEVLVFHCGHVICTTCFIGYAQSCISERNLTLIDDIGFTIDCPFNCDKSWIEVAHFLLLDQYFYTLYEKIADEEQILLKGGIFCPYPDCGEAFFPDTIPLTECQLHQCDKCQLSCCVKCTFEKHFQKDVCQLDDEIQKLNFDLISIEQKTEIIGKQTYLKSLIDKFNQLRLIAVGGDIDPSTKWQNSKLMDVLSKSTIQAIAKPCPKCRLPTERNGGCMHMICTRKWCKFHWCWICQVEWNRSCMSLHWFD